MKIAFVHKKNKFSETLLQLLKDKLNGHELILWESGKTAPTNDFEVVLLIGKFSREQMAAQPKLLLIQTASAGYEGVDVDAAAELGIWVSYAPSHLTGNAVSVAEFALMLMMGASRRINQVLDLKPGEQIPVIPPALHGKAVCIVGLGSIGRLLAERLKPFGMQLTATDDHPKQVPEGMQVYPMDKLKEALSKADFVVLCIRATKENENLINAEILQSMKKGVVLINIARGSLIDEDALFNAIKSGQVAAAGLDVLKKEPVDPNNPLLTLPQALITPHIAGITEQTLHGTADYVAKAIQDFISGKKLKSIINQPENPKMQLQADH